MMQDRETGEQKQGESRAGSFRLTRVQRTVLLFALLMGVVVLMSPAIFLAAVWWRDGTEPLPIAPAGFGDASRMSQSQPSEVIAVSNDPITAERQLTALVIRAAQQGSRISISGAQHSMGGHTIYPGATVLDMVPFNRSALDEKRKLLTVGAGARWKDIIPLLDAHGLAVSIMQSNNDFTVGGSLSANCHGWQNDRPPISSTVESFRLLTAAGSILRCSRTENQELFSLALGGYGLFGVILEVELRVVPNEFYVAESRRVVPRDYDRLYRELTNEHPDIGLAYGRISVAPSSFLDDAVLTVFRRFSGDRKPRGTLTEEVPSLIKRLVFRGEVESEFGKDFRWWLERRVGQTAGQVLSRNQVMNQPSDFFANRDPGATDILHEYFIPVARLGEFTDRMRPVFLKMRPELLNVTVRNVKTDTDTFLRYAREDVYGLVMLFHQRRDPASEAAMQALTRELIDAALACGGTYYLPYRPHATREQFLAAYPQAKAFFALKRQYDPAGIFQNTFLLNYGTEPARGAE